LANVLLAVLMAIGASAVVVYGTAIIGYFALKISRDWGRGDGR